MRTGRCATCGAAADLRAIRRQERREAFFHVIGDEWFWWVGEIIALVLITLALADLVPLWTLAVAAFLLLRPLSHMLVLAVRSAIDELPI